MSRCGGCGAGRSACTCSFSPDPTITVTGNGRSYAPINFRPTNVPKPRPYGHMTRSASDQAIGVSATAAVTFDNSALTMGAFAGGMVSLVTYPTRLTATQDGYYLAYGFVLSNTAGATLWIRKNGNNPLESTIGVSAGPLSVMTLVDLVVGEYLELMVTAGTGGTTLIRTDLTYAADGGPSNTPPQFWAQWMRSVV